MDITTHNFLKKIVSCQEIGIKSESSESLPSSLLDSLNHQRADNRSKKNYNPAACGPKTTVTERQRR